MNRTVRRVFGSLNLAASLALLAALFLMVNYLGMRHYARWDFTSQRLGSLSDQTRTVLGALGEDGKTRVTVFFQPAQPLYELIRTLLDAYVHASPNITVEYIDPEQDRARSIEVAQRYELTEPNVVVIASADRHRVLQGTELAEYDFETLQFGAQPRLKSFNGENAFTSAIVSLTRPSRTRVWSAIGHGEKSLEEASPLGLSSLKQALAQQDLELEETALLRQREIPEDVRLLLIAGPERRFTDEEREMLGAYLERGGRVLALLDPLHETNLEALLSDWGILLAHDIVVDPGNQLPFVSAGNLIVTSYSRHPIVEKLKQLMTLYPLARSVRPAVPSPEGVTVQPLAQTSEVGWGETSTEVQLFEFDESNDLAGPLPIAVAARRAAPADARLVVIGDSDFVANSQLDNAGNRDFALSAVHWLLGEEELIGIGPKRFDDIKLVLTEAQTRRVRLLTFWALPLLTLLGGAAMWWSRRR